MNVRKMSLLVGAALAAGSCCTGQELQHWNAAALANTPALPSSAGRALGSGDLRLAGEVNPMLPLGPNTYETAPADAPGLWIPRMQLGGSAYLGVGKVVELGAQARFASSSWADRNVRGLAYFPSGDVTTAVFGVGMRLNLEAGSPKTVVAILSELNIVDFPQYEQGWGTWRATCCAGWVCACSDYTEDWKQESVPRYSGAQLVFGLQVEHEIAEGLRLFAIAGTEEVPSNVREETHINYSWWEVDRSPSPPHGDRVVFGGGGAEFDYGILATTAVVYFPFQAESYTDYGPMVSMSVGLRLAGEPSYPDAAPRPRARSERARPRVDDGALSHAPQTLPDEVRPAAATVPLPKALDDWPGW